MPSCAEYRLRLRGNYRDKDMPRYESISRYSIYRAIATSLGSLCVFTISLKRKKELQRARINYTGGGRAKVPESENSIQRNVQSESEITGVEWPGYYKNPLGGEKWSGSKNGVITLFRSDAIPTDTYHQSTNLNPTSNKK